ncbi:coilin [Crotalus adamanteus]|uniref:Coilin n=1 Tax=Crotalus adamanteus TaxID=8729 RepID=A0AAW1BZ85_CROAD
MAAAMGSGCEAPVRLRLLFDYPPPMTPACGLCWLLVEPNQVRLITDLISLIREKFGFSRHARLNLFLDGALLPPTESARLVRDNDSLRVRLEEIVGLNSYDTVTNGSSSLSKSQRKRQRKLEAKDSESEDEDPNKRKKSKWNFEQKEEKSTNIQDSVTLGKKKKAAPERSHMMDTERETKKAKNQSSSSDSDSSSEEEQQSSNLRNKLPYQKQETVTGHSSKTEPKSSSSESDDSSESETDALKKQNAIDNLSVRGNDKQLSDVSYGLASNLKENRRGRGRGETPSWRGPRVRGCRGMTRDRGRGERVHFFYNYSSENQKQKQLNEAATNASVIIQNPVEAPKKDYSTLPLLAAPPQVGQKIAFKLLELTENYTPEVSDYKEGKLVSWNPVNKQLELEILSFSSVAKEPGKFDLVYQSEDGDETIEYAVSQDRKITQSWEALIEPRLIIDSPPNESGPPKEIPSNMNLPDPQM